MKIKRKASDSIETDAQIIEDSYEAAESFQVSSQAVGPVNVWCISLYLLGAPLYTLK